MENLKNAIHIENEYQRIAAPILEHLKNVSKQFIGKKIDTAKGLSAKFAEAIAFDRKSIDVKPIEGAKWANVHFVGTSNSYNDLRVEISLCFSNGSTGCSYKARTWYFGKTENGILLSVDDNCKVEVKPLDYQTEIAAIKKFRELEQQMEKAQEKIKIGREAYQYIHLKDLEKM